MNRKGIVQASGAMICLALVSGPLAAADPVMPEKEVAQAIERTIAQGGCPGAVVLALKGDKVLFRKAYGSRSLEPAKTPMTPDVIFDMASLTKPIAAATSIMILVDEGKLKVTDPVVKYWPEFGQNGKDKITIEQLLLHVAGFGPNNPAADYMDGNPKSWERLAALKLAREPGSGFQYSSLGYIVLGRIVEFVSGKPLDEFASEKIFKPLGMKDTGFNPLKGPNAKPPERIAPTAKRRGDIPILGEVHDPRAYGLGGVAGHAGLFSTADDLAHYARMLIHGGELDSKRILSPEAVRIMTTPREVPGGLGKDKPGLRNYGFDVDTTMSSNRGTAFPKGKNFGHTGFTGTSIWVDLPSQTAVIFLSNRVHPDDKGDVTKLRGQVATLLEGAMLKN